jgi:anti-sigma B factor antagonist
VIGFREKEKNTGTGRLLRSAGSIKSKQNQFTAVFSLMQIVNEVEGNIFIISLKGELDASSAVLLDEQLANSAEAKYEAILIDCTGLEYISSAGLGAFMSHMHQLEDAGTRLVFFGMSERVRNVFEIVGLDVLTSIVATREDALSAKGK